MNTEKQQKIVKIARICHEANRAYCSEIGDDSQPEWLQSPQWQRESAIKGVSFHLENSNASPSHSHDEWLREKYSNGWKFGPIKDAELREHPCCVPYEELPRSQQLKDSLFKVIVHALAPMVEPNDT